MSERPKGVYKCKQKKSKIYFHWVRPKDFCQAVGASLERETGLGKRNEPGSSLFKIPMLKSSSEGFFHPLISGETTPTFAGLRTVLLRKNKNRLVIKLSSTVLVKSAQYSGSSPHPCMDK